MTQLNAANNYGLQPGDLTEICHHFPDLLAQADRLVEAFNAACAARPEIDMVALRTVLQALTGAPHEIRELQVTRSLPGNPIDTLIDQFNAWAGPPKEET